MHTRHIVFVSIVAGMVFGMNACVAEKSSVTVVERPDASKGNAYYAGNRAPLEPSPFIKLPVGAIKPKGWVRKQLELQADGFHGHLGEISGFLKKKDNAWVDPEKGRHGWEEVPYWLKGYANAAFVLGDKRLLKETKYWIEAAIKSQRPDGWFGPESNLTAIDGKPDLWPNMIMQFCLQDYYDYSGDARVITLLTNYFTYISTIPDKDFLPGYWDKMRGGDLLYSVYWTYNKTGESALLELAQKVHRNTARWDKDIINWHNVNIAQAFGESGTYWMQSKDPADLAAAYRNYAKIRELYGQVPGAMFGSDENCREGYDDPRQSIETCGIVEEMLSDETLLLITGDPIWADRCEDATFNSLPAALTPDMKALRYLTSPNMIQSDAKNKSPGVQNGGPMFLMNPHIHRCCQHNWGHGWPYYAETLWATAPGNGLAALMYAESEVTAKVGDGTKVTISEKTKYPFDDTITFSVAGAKNTQFPLYLRIPGWCAAPLVSINGKKQKCSAKAGSYIVIDRAWNDGDTVTLKLPMEVTLRTWTNNHNSVSVDRGPLTYSLKIDEKYVRHGGTEKWPAWEIYPTTAWNYGLIVSTEHPGKSFKVVERKWPENDMPFTADGTPVELVAKGKQIPEWQQDHLGLVGLLQDSPVISAEPEEKITLIPMGAARLRIASFPVIGTGAGAHKWQAPPKAYPYAVSASHVHDDINAVKDRYKPKSSHDHTIARLTFWDHKGTKEWVQYEFKKPKKVSHVKAYWFDDRPGGGCAVPASWSVEYRDGDKWKPVETKDAYGTAQDTFNEVSITPVTTTALRLNIQLQKGFSGGVLEWEVR
jgi:hypothetical protein